MPLELGIVWGHPWPPFQVQRCLSFSLLLVTCHFLWLSHLPSSICAGVLTWWWVSLTLSYTHLHKKWLICSLALVLLLFLLSKTNSATFLHEFWSIVNPMFRKVFFLETFAKPGLMWSRLVKETVSCNKLLVVINCCHTCSSEHTVLHCCCTVGLAAWKIIIAGNGRDRRWRGKSWRPAPGTGRLGRPSQGAWQQKD